MNSYYTTPINETELIIRGYEPDKDGRYSKLAHPKDNSFERISTCLICGGAVIGYRKIFCRNGTLQVRVICENDCNRYNAKLFPAAKRFAAYVRRETHE